MTPGELSPTLQGVATAFTPQRLADGLLQGVPQPTDRPTAAVAVVIRDGDDGAELLMIERAPHPADPWSGHVAFPGGRTDPGDATTWDTAVRETLEEVQIDVTTAAHLGRLSDVEGRPRTNRLRVTPHVCWADHSLPAPQPNYEVAQAMWVPAAALADPRRRFDYEPQGYGGVSFPGVALPAGPTLWGMTLRMVADLFDRAGWPTVAAGLLRDV